MQGVDPIPVENFQGPINFVREADFTSPNACTPSPISGFKEDILIAVKEFEDRLNKKYSLYNEEMEMKMKLYEAKIQEMSGKLSEISQSQSHDKLQLEKIDDLLIFQRKSNDQLTSHEIRISNNAKELTNACYKYDKLYLDNLMVPGIIGDGCKFKNLREYLDHNINQVSLLLNFKDKHTLDLKSYKERLEIIIKQVNSQMDGFFKDALAYTNKSIKECEDNYKEMNNDLNARINELRMENSKYAVQLRTQANELAIEWDKIMNIQAEIDKKLEERVKEMKASHKSTIDSFGEVHLEFSRIKRKFNDISEFIKDVRFRRNLQVDVSKNELRNLARKIKFEGKKNWTDDEGNKAAHSGDVKELEVESIIKKYINGECDFNQKKLKGKNKDKETDNINQANANANEKDDDSISLEENDQVIHELAEEVEGSQFAFEKKLSQVIEPKIYQTNRSENDSQKKSSEGFARMACQRRKTISVTPNICNTLKNPNNNNSCNDSFKKECDKKITTNERKIIEIEHFTKKKLEELATQIKLFLPINFNPYMQSYRNEKLQITAINQTIAGEGESNGRTTIENQAILTNPKTVNLNFVEPNTVPRNKTILINESNNCPNMSNFQKFPNKRVLQKPPRTSQGKIQGNASADEKKILLPQYEMRPSEEKTENNPQEYKIIKKFEKPKLKDIDNSGIGKPTNYIHLSKLMTNVPKYSSNDDSEIIKKLSTNLLKPLKQCLENMDLGESNNTHNKLSLP